MTSVISVDQKVKAALKPLIKIVGIKYASLCVTSKPHERGARIKQAERLGDACIKQTT